MNDGARVDGERRIGTPGSRPGSPWPALSGFAFGILRIVLLLFVFGGGVLAGTSGVYSDGVSELRRLIGPKIEKEGMMSRLLDTIGRLDASEGIDVSLTRHGMAESLANIGHQCGMRIDTLEQNVEQSTTSGLKKIRSRIATEMKERQLFSEKMNNDFSNLRETTETMTEPLQATRDICGLALWQLNEVLQVSRTNSNSDTSQRAKEQYDQ